MVKILKAEIDLLMERTLPAPTYALAEGVYKTHSSADDRYHHELLYDTDQIDPQKYTAIDASDGWSRGYAKLGRFRPAQIAQANIRQRTQIRSSCICAW